MTGAYQWQTSLLINSIPGYSQKKYYGCQPLAARMKGALAMRFIDDRDKLVSFIFCMLCLLTSALGSTKCSINSQCHRFMNPMNIPVCCNINTPI